MDSLQRIPEDGTLFAPVFARKIVLALVQPTITRGPEASRVRLSPTSQRNIFLPQEVGIVHGRASAHD